LRDDSIEVLLRHSAHFTSQLLLPLKLQTGINFFVYLKMYDNGRIVRHCSSFEWSKVYMDNAFYNDIFFYAQFVTACNESREKFFLWEASAATRLLSACYDYDIWHGLSSFQKHEGFVEAYSFATTQKNIEVYNTYFNHMDLLKDFLRSFKNSMMLQDNTPLVLNSTLNSGRIE